MALVSAVPFSPTVGQDLSNVIGYLEFHIINDLTIPQSKLIEFWNKHGLDRIRSLHPLRSCDVFRRVTSTLTNTAVVLASGQETKLLVREVSSNTTGIERHVVQETIDRSTNSLVYTTVAKLVYSRLTEHVNLYREASCPVELEPYLQQVVDDYYRLCDTHVRSTLRNAINHLLNTVNSIPLLQRSQVKFIPATYTDVVEGLRNFAADVNAYIGSQTTTFHTAPVTINFIPVLDIPDQRDIIANCFVTHIERSIAELVQEVDALLQQRDFDLSKISSYIAAYQELGEKIKHYEQLLNINFDLLTSKVEQMVNSLLTIQS